jgi:hypothetical protein
VIAKGTVLLCVALVSSCKEARSEVDVRAEESAPIALVGPTASPSQWRAPLDEVESEALLRLEQGSKALVTTLMQRLMSAMGEAGGMIEAVRVCADEAQELTAGVATEQGMALGRSSTRLRNPANHPPAWVADWLAKHEGREADSVEATQGIVEEAGKRFARRVAPIGVQPLCVNCHGPSQGIPPEVRAILVQRYPEDQATGYAVGDLRGAVWAELELPARRP